MAAGLDFVLLVWTTTVGEKIGVISREDNDKVFFFLAFLQDMQQWTADEVRGELMRKRKEQLISVSHFASNRQGVHSK